MTDQTLPLELPVEAAVSLGSAAVHASDEVLAAATALGKSAAEVSAMALSGPVGPVGFAGDRYPAFSTDARRFEGLLREVRNNGQVKSDRTGTGTISVFGPQISFDLRTAFPLITSKFVNFDAVFEELRWFLSGSTNIKDLNSKIWDSWQDENGSIGPMYGHQWRSWPRTYTTVEDDEWVQTERPVDQISTIIDQIKNDPDSRRIIVSAWNVGQLDEMALAPCHAMFQFYVQDGELSCKLYQRSADMFLGVPFNIASYALLTHMVAHQCGLKVGDFIWSGGDCHIYKNHLDQVDLQLSRGARPLPQLKFVGDKPASLFDYKREHVEIVGYDPHPAIKGEVAV
jgi:thymidylate synthase